MSIPSLTSIPTTQPSCGDISLDRPFQPCPDTAFITTTGNTSEPQGCFVQPAGFFCAPLSTTRGFLYQDDTPSQNSITHANAPSVYIPRFHAPTNDNSSRPSPPLLAVDGQPIRYGGVARLGQACIGVPLPDATILTTDPRFQTMITLAQRRLTEALKGSPGSTSSGAAAWSPGAAADGSSIFSLWGDCEEGAFCDFSQATKSPSGDKIGICREQLPNYHQCSSYMQCSSRRCDFGSVAGRTGNPSAVAGAPAAAADSAGGAVEKGSSPRQRRHHRGRSLKDVDDQPPTAFLSSSSTDHSRALQNQRRSWPARLDLSERRLGSVPVCLPSNIYHDNTSNGNLNDGIHFSGNGNGTESNDHGASSESDQESKARVSIWIGALLGMVAILVGIFLLGLLRRRQKLRRDKQQQQQQQQQQSQSQQQQQLQQRQLQVHHHRRKHRSRSKSIKRTNTNPGPDFEPEPTSDLALDMDREGQSPLALGSIHRARGADGVADEKNRFYMMDQTRRGGYGDDGDDDSQFMYHLSTAATTMTTTSVGGQDERKPDSDSRFARFWSRLRKAEQPPPSSPEANDGIDHPERVISGRRRSKGHSHHGLKGPSKRSDLTSQTRSVARLTSTTNSSFNSSSHSLPLPSPPLEANLSSPVTGLENQLGSDRIVQGRGMDTIMDMEEEDPSRANHVNWSNTQDQWCFSEGEMMDFRGSALAPPSPLHVSPISPPPVSSGGGSSRSSSRMLKRQSAAQQQAAAAAAMGTETSKG